MTVCNALLNISHLYFAHHQHLKIYDAYKGKRVEKTWYTDGDKEYEQSIPDVTRKDNLTK